MTSVIIGRPEFDEILYKLFAKNDENSRGIAFTAGSEIQTNPKNFKKFSPKNKSPKLLEYGKIIL